MEATVMRRLGLGTLTVLAAGILLASGGSANEHTPQNEQAATDHTEACMQMMQGAGVTEEGRKAMRDFMQSDRAPQAMANMMEMARRMGSGDVMLGMTRMMEMMGGMGGGMMGGQGAMPPGREPRKGGGHD